MDVNEMLDKLRLEYNRVLKERDTAQRINEERKAIIEHYQSVLDRITAERDALQHTLRELDENTSTIEQVEVCPHCESENVFKNWDVNEKGYIATCQECGRKIFLCDACYHSDDNPTNKCDWAFIMNPHGGFCGHRCFRGKIKLGE